MNRNVERALAESRKEVEALLAACAPGSETFAPAMDKMSRRKMRVLCRAWLAVDEAASVALELIEELTGDPNYERWDALLRDHDGVEST